MADDPEYQAAEDAANEAAKPILDALESIGANVETLASEMGKMRHRIDVLEALLEDANQTSMGLLKVGLAHEFSMWRSIAATDPKCANMSPERREELAPVSERPRRGEQRLDRAGCVMGAAVEAIG